VHAKAQCTKAAMVVVPQSIAEGGGRSVAFLLFPATSTPRVFTENLARAEAQGKVVGVSRFDQTSSPFGGFECLLS
jgi:hypothetical protein